MGHYASEMMCSSCGGIPCKCKCKKCGNTKYGSCVCPCKECGSTDRDHVCLAFLYKK